MKKKNLLQGTIKRNPDGFGFFIPDDPEHPDVYIPRHSMTGIMTSDKVMIEVEPEYGGERFRGEVVKVVHRGTKKIVGQFFPLNEKQGILKDEGKGWGLDLKIKIEDSMGAKKGELVAAEITQYPEAGKDFLGKVIEVLGTAEDPLNDIKRILITHHIPSEFSPNCLKEAEKFSEHVSQKDIEGRHDLRALKFVTIDGATAKDFDDAIYVETNQMGFLLYVAIADVSHYVQVGSEIDKDAYERGTSVYFPNFVVPMLPEILSNGLCSLNPHLPRLSLVAEIQMDFNGEVQETDFYEAVIESKARVTYGEAQELIEGNRIEKLDHVEDEIKRASDLAKVLMAKRFREGSLDLEIPETQLVIDAGGNPVDIIRSERLFAHRVIEEMMLAANVAVAKFFSEKEIPAMYRIHEEPNSEAMATLEKYLSNFGGSVKLQGTKLQKRLTKALQEFEGKPQAQVLHILTLRSMSQAKYSQNNLGHFGLGFEHYTHFTSPIRRYPDLIVHRLLKSLVMVESGYSLMSEEDLATAGVMLSACEQRSVKAERQLTSIKKARFVEKFIGQDFDGIISSVTKFGVFVLLRAYELDGLVRNEDLGSEKFDKFEFDEDNLRLVSIRSGMAYCIGDAIKIKVVSVDIDAGQINFGLAERPARSTSAPTKKTAPTKISDNHKSKKTQKAVPQKKSVKHSARVSEKTMEHYSRKHGGRNLDDTKETGGGNGLKATDKMKKIFDLLDQAAGPKNHQGDRHGDRRQQARREDDRKSKDDQDNKKDFDKNKKSPFYNKFSKNSKPKAKSGSKNKGKPKRR